MVAPAHGESALHARMPSSSLNSSSLNHGHIHNFASLQSASHNVQAVFSHQGPVLERELADLKSSIQEADTAVDTAKEALKVAGMVSLGSHSRHEHSL